MNIVDVIDDKSDKIFCPDVIKNKYQEILMPHINIKNINNPVIKRKIYPINVNNFSSKFYDIFPKFKGFNFSNILIAGGCVSDILVNNKIKDIDIFIYGLNEEEATDRVYESINWFCQFNKTIECIFKDNYVEFTTQTIINNEVINDTKIQIIFKLYDSINEILHSFDLGCCSVGFDGRNIYMTSLARLTYEMGYNILIPNKLTKNITYRLLKYIAKGFGIIFPNLNHNSLSVRLPFSPEDEDENQIQKEISLQMIFSYGNNLSLIRPFNILECEYITSYFGENDEIFSIKLNIKKLLKKEHLYYIIKNKEFLNVTKFTEQYYNEKLQKSIYFIPNKTENFDKTIIELSNNMILLNEKIINDKYNKLISYIDNFYQYFEDNSLEKNDIFYCSESVITNYIRNLSLEMKYLLLEKDIEQIIKLIKSLFFKIKNIFGIKKDNFENSEIIKIISEQNKKTLELYNEYIKNKPKIFWKTKENDKFFTSFREKIPPEEWYGQYYLIN